MRTSENLQKAKFAEFQFPDVGCIRLAADPMGLGPPAGSHVPKNIVFLMYKPAGL